MNEPMHVIGFKLLTHEYRRLDAWRRRQASLPSMSLAVRTLISRALDAEEKKVEEKK